MKSTGICFQNRLFFFKQSLVLLGFFIFLLSGCSVTAVRPVQEMSNAEIALKAAKDLNADSLTPELYRKAVDFFFRAKREYRLKNFDRAKLYSLQATKLAEKAEFESYRMGGATPEASAKLSPEGSVGDPEAAFRSANDTGKPQEKEVGWTRPTSKDPVNDSRATDEGVSLDAINQKEEALGKPDTKNDISSTSVPRSEPQLENKGSSSPGAFYSPKVLFKLAELKAVNKPSGQIKFPDGVAPVVSSSPPVLGGVPPATAELEQKKNVTDSARDNPYRWNVNGNLSESPSDAANINNRPVEHFSEIRNEIPQIQMSEMPLLKSDPFPFVRPAGSTGFSTEERIE